MTFNDTLGHRNCCNSIAFRGNSDCLATCRMEDNRKLKTLMFGIVDGRNKRGRPCREWMDDTVSWCKTGTQELNSLAQDRRRRKLITRQAMDTNGRWSHGSWRRRYRFLLAACSNDVAILHHFRDRPITFTLTLQDVGYNVKRYDAQIESLMNARSYGQPSASVSACLLLMCSFQCLLLSHHGRPSHQLPSFCIHPVILNLIYMYGRDLWIWPGQY